MGWDCHGMDRSGIDSVWLWITAIEQFFFLLICFAVLPYDNGNVVGFDVALKGKQSSCYGHLQSYCL